jgi:ferredoxin-fold anticodon binding domain-containing protein
MKQLITLALIIIALASCSENRSGNREPKTNVARVRVLSDNTVNWIRLNAVEARVYQVGDTVKMSLNTHLITDLDTEPKDYMLVRLDSIVNN